MNREDIHPFFSLNHDLQMIYFTLHYRQECLAFSPLYLDNIQNNALAWMWRM